MGKVITLAHNFDQGFLSDESRAELGRSQAYRMRNWIPQLDTPLRKRGGWTYGSPNLSTLGGTITHVNAIGWLPFAADGHLVAISQTGSIYQLKRFDGLGGALVTNTGTTNLAPTQNIFWHKTGTIAYGIMLAGLNQGNLPPNRYYDTGGGVYQAQLLGGTPPAARMGFSWGDYLVLGNYYDPTAGNVLKNYRWAFSAVGNPDSWTISGVSSSTLDFPEEIIYGIPIRNAIIAYGYENCYVITGDTPPPGGNLVRRPLFGGNGTFDPKSVVGWRDFAIWANSSGVYQSDGSTLTDLTYAGGISNYYREKVVGFNLLAGYTAAAGIYRDHYVISFVDGLGAEMVTLACDLQRKVWTEWTNVPAGCYAHVAATPGTGLYSSGEELFFGHGASPRIGKISDLWVPVFGNSADADGTAVLPVLETPFYTMDTDGLKRIRNVYLRYDVRTPGVLRVSATYDPGPSPSYTQLAPDLVSTPNMIRRGPVGVRGRRLGVALKIEQVGLSAQTSLYGIESEGHALEGSK